MQKELLLISLFVCHWLADYTHLSTAWMLNAKRFGKPLFPIFIHALVHTILMCFVLEIYGNLKVIGYSSFNFKFSFVDKLFFVQLITHFLIDVWKGKMNSWFPKLQSPINKWHWIVFGFDQLLHAVVIIFMTYYAVSQSNS